MAKGRPLLATVLMTTGIIALAVPGSSAFAGEFLILAGVFQEGWLYGVIGGIAIVLAAMYMLRLISAVLHRQRGVLVTDEALDLRPAEMCVIVPLVACLLALSAWPAAISGHSVPAPSPIPISAAGGTAGITPIGYGVGFGEGAAVTCTQIKTQPPTNKCMTARRSSVQSVSP
jgi:NADH:ubiquinone oxidoreductase subunit 5 (subunit L)/multisubunit Na+/H+ antiporter MnhA subunit